MHCKLHSESIDDNYVTPFQGWPLLHSLRSGPVPKSDGARSGAPSDFPGQLSFCGITNGTMLPGRQCGATAASETNCGDHRPSAGFYPERAMMADTLTSERRSWNVSRIRGRDTRPELMLRSLLHRAGFRLRLQAKPRPDIIISFSPRYRTAIFVHGCFSALWLPQCNHTFDASEILAGEVRWKYQPRRSQPSSARSSRLDRSDRLGMRA